MAYVAVQSCTISHSTGSLATLGTFTITTLPATKLKTESKGVYFGNINITFAGGNYPGAVVGSLNGVTAGVLTGSSTKDKHDNKPVVLEGDTVTIPCVYQPTGTPPPPPVNVSIDAEISAAGQTSYEGE